jgi:predicted nucleic acid-binding protein
VIFVDANVFMYAVGRAHPLKDEARRFLLERPGGSLVTSAEVLQELLHAYLAVGRLDTLDAALQLATDRTSAIWPIEPADVLLARTLAERHDALAARDLLHMACCVRRGVGRVHTYDRSLAAAFQP